MQKQIVLLLLGCAALTQAVETSSLRTKLSKLAQIKARGGADDADGDVEGDLGNHLDCNVTVPAPELGDLSGDLLDWCPHEFGENENGGLGAGLSSSAFQSLQLSQSQNLASIPDTMQNTTVQALCNSCNAAAHEEASSASRIRTFDIHGQICVEENIRFCETGEARERSQGASEKLGVCVVTNEGTSDETDLGSLQACDGELSYTPPE